MNQTKQDAFLRVLDARMGSLAENPSEEYLKSLRRHLYEWIEQVDMKLIPLMTEEALAASIEEDL